MVCVVVKSVLSKVIARCRAKVMLQDTIRLISHKSGSEAVKIFLFSLKCYSGYLRDLLLVLNEGGVVYNLSL